MVERSWGAFFSCWHKSNSFGDTECNKKKGNIMIRLLMTWAARFASLNLLRLMGFPFGLIIRIFMGIYNAIKAHMPNEIEIPYEIVKKDKKKSFETMFN